MRVGPITCRERLFVARFIETFKDYPPRQPPASFTIDQIMQQMKRESEHRIGR